MKIDQALSSAWASLSRFLWWWGFWIPLVRLVIRLRIVLPGVTTAHAKFNRPIRDWISRNVAVRLRMNELRSSLRKESLSSGSLNSQLIVSISIPKNVKTVVGGTIFFSLIGRLISLASVRKDVSAFNLEHSGVLGWPTNKKSSCRWIEYLTLNLFSRIHWSVELNFSNKLQE